MRLALAGAEQARECHIPFGEAAVKCFFDDNEAVGVCRFCGRAACKEHAEKRLPYISTIYVGASNTPKAVVVADALWCGHCKPEAQPVPMPEIY